jgi:hypothetical protein
VQILDFLQFGLGQLVLSRVVSQPHHTRIYVLDPVDHYIQVKIYHRLNRHHFEWMVYLRKILVSLGWFRGFRNSLRQIVPIGFQGCAKNDVLGENGSIESTGVFLLYQKRPVRFTPYPGYYPFQILSGAKCYVSTRTGKYELHVFCLGQFLVKSHRMFMWSKLVASGAILLGPSFELFLERAFAINAVVFTTSERAPLLNRQLVHIVFLFHVITYMLKEIIGAAEGFQKIITITSIAVYYSKHSGLSYANSLRQDILGCH